MAQITYGPYNTLILTDGENYKVSIPNPSGSSPTNTGEAKHHEYKKSVSVYGQSLNEIKTWVTNNPTANTGNNSPATRNGTPNQATPPSFIRGTAAYVGEKLGLGDNAVHSYAATNELNGEPAWVNITDPSHVLNFGAVIQTVTQNPNGSIGIDRYGVGNGWAQDDWNILADALINDVWLDTYPKKSWPLEGANSAIGIAVQDGWDGRHDNIWDPRNKKTPTQLRDALYGGAYEPAPPKPSGGGQAAQNDRLGNDLNGPSSSSSRPSGSSQAAQDARRGPNDLNGPSSSSKKPSGSSKPAQDTRRGNDLNGPSSSSKKPSGSSKPAQDTRRGNDLNGPSSSSSKQETKKETKKEEKKKEKESDRRPILLDLSGNGINVTELNRSNTYTDGNGSGLLTRSAWAGVGTGVLFFDPANAGAITQKNQYVFTEWDPTAKDDMQALRNVFDSNGDGKFTSADAKFALFKVMVTNADGTATAKTLSELGIVSLDLKVDATDIAYTDGSHIDGQTTFTKADGTTGTVASMGLATEGTGHAIKTTTSTDASGTVTLINTAFNADGSIAYIRTSITTAGGASRTITMDKDGDGVIDEKQVITKLTDASGQVTETWTIYNGGGIKISAANDNFVGSLPCLVPHKLNKWLKTA